MQGPAARRLEGSRYLAFAAACALQLLFILAFVAMGHGRGTSPPPPTVTARIVSFPPDASSMAASPAAPASRLIPSPLSVSPVIPPLSVPGIDLPSPPTSPPQPPRGATDWARAAQLAATQVSDAQALAQRRRQATGETPWPQARQDGSSHPVLRWSHQPLTRWFDFNPQTLVSSIHLGRHCELAFFVILPGFGCILGHIDSGGGGHFDMSFDVRSLEPPPLELPRPGLPRPPDLHPWRRRQ